MDFKKYLGRWVNTFKQDHIIDHFLLSEENGQLMIETFATDSTGHWGKVDATPMGMLKTPEKFAAFEASYDLPDGKVILSVNDSKGLLIIAGFHHRNEGAGFFSREFFYKD